MNLVKVSCIMGAVMEPPPSFKITITKGLTANISYIHRQKPED
jgi:hypothetical protein